MAGADAFANDQAPTGNKAAAGPRSLGAFATQDEAIAAAKRAGLAPGDSINARIGDEEVVIGTDGTQFVVVRNAHQTGSGQPQRLPTTALQEGEP